MRHRARTKHAHLHNQTSVVMSEQASRIHAQSAPVAALHLPHVLGQFAASLAANIFSLQILTTSLQCRFPTPDLVLSLHNETPAAGWAVLDSSQLRL